MNCCISIATLTGTLNIYTNNGYIMDLHKPILKLGYIHYVYIIL